MSTLLCEDPNRPLKEALLDALECILSPDQEVRKAAEKRVKVLEVTEDYGIQLLEVMIDPEYDVAVRQLASVLFNQYVECHWTPSSASFEDPEIPGSLKEDIKHILPLGLKEPVSKIRNSVAHTIFTVAWYDWPEQWHNLIESLLAHLSNGDEWAVHGSIRVIREMCNTMDRKICSAAPVILSEMNEIVRNDQRFSSKIRSRAIEVFVSCATAFTYEVKIQKQLLPLKGVVDQLLPNFYETLVKILLVPDCAHVDMRMKTQVIKALTSLMRESEKKAIDWLPQLLRAVWQTLTVSAMEYSTTVIVCIEEDCQSIDSDGEVIGIETLIFSIFDFVNCLIESPKLKKTVAPGLPDLLYYVIFYSQITSDQSSTWSNDPNQFIGDESSESYKYTVRLSAQDLMASLCDSFKLSCVEALTQAISKHLQEASSKKLSGDPNWWRIHEACMLTLGGINNVVANASGTPLCDVQWFIQNVVIPDMTAEGYPFLLAKCLWFGSKYTSLLSPEMNLHFIQAAVSALQQGQHPCVRISAVRALAGFCQHFTKMKNTQMLLPFFPSITEPLLNLATMFSYPVMRLVFESMVVILSIDQNFAASIESKVTPFTIAVFLKFNNDPIVTMLVQDVFKTLCTNPQSIGPLQQRLIPILVSILNSPDDKVSLSLLSVTLDVLQTVVRYSQPPLSSCLINNAFPAVINRVLHTEESAVLQSGGECLRAYISVSPDQVFNFQDNEGLGGLSLVFQVLGQLLNPFASDNSALYVGRLAITLVNKAGTYLGENLDHLLKAVLSKMQCTQTNCVIQSLVLVYAYLVHTQLDAVLNFLSTVPGPTGESALQFVLTEWCSHQHLFGVCYEGKICITALCKLLHYGISSQDSRLSDIRVSGDAIGNPDPTKVFPDLSRTVIKNGKGSPDQWTIIPLFVKIFKLLLSALNTCISSTKLKKELGEEKDDFAGSDENACDPNSDDDSSSEVSSTDSDVGVADLLGSDTQLLDEDYPDALDDPIYHIDLYKYLTDFCLSLRQQPCFDFFVNHLTPKECNTLCKIGINVKMDVSVSS
ncbi:importin-9 [Ischnura elegans]|uniref:importin-9 n=1 Tax=Ischnura elegans TaxID=197161 RepID=UPI001ED87197|nr:importin-9 [Ischnura elegans]XP_046405690.1 importin-9 [Ischnura elegans]